MQVLSCLKNSIETHMIGGRPSGNEGSESGSDSEGAEDSEEQPAKRKKLLPGEQLFN